MSEVPAVPMSPEELKQMRAENKEAAARAESKPFKCKVCETLLGPTEIHRLGTTHNTKESRVVRATPPASGVISHKQQVYCRPCAEQQLRLKLAAGTHRAASNQQNGPSVHIPPKLLGKDAALAQVRAKRAAEEAARKAPPVWEMVEPGLFRAQGGMRVERVDQKSWRVISGKASVVVKGLQEAFELAAELRRQ